MSWVTVVWSMTASACLTLAAIYGLIWYRNRSSWAHLFFAATAASTTVLTFFELRLMQAQTPADVLAARMWAHVPLFFWLVSITWFVRTYLGAGRLWLAWTICGLRAVSLVVNLVLGQNPDFGNVRSLQFVQFLGEPVAVLGAAPNAMTPVTQFASMLVLVFVADASVTAWLRGERRKALMVGGSVEFFLVASLGSAMAALWAGLQIPIVFSLFYLGLVVVMGYELSRDVLRASELVRELRENEARMSLAVTASQRAELAVRSLSGRLLSAQEEERRRIARELHDNVSQQIAMLAIRLGQLAANPGEDPARMTALIRELRQRAVTISTEIHNLSHRLHSTKLEMLGLVDALRGHCEELQAQGVHVRLEHENVPAGLSSDVALCLFRIAQEGLNNVAKHSAAHEAQVTLRLNGDALVLQIADRGRGFNGDGAGAQGGLGLASIRERVRLLGGEFTVRSQPARGTTITASVPAVARASTADTA